MHKDENQQHEFWIGYTLQEDEQQHHQQQQDFAHGNTPQEHDLQMQQQQEDFEFQEWQENFLRQCNGIDEYTHFDL